MPILSFTSQPATGSINAAYRPVVLTVRATASDGTARPPVVYCDIYFGNVFYKTLSRSQYFSLTSTYSDWTFDIQDAAQEYLKTSIGPNGGNAMYNPIDSYVTVNCLFRSSGINAQGFIQSEGTEPVQATGGTVAVSGTGTTSNTFAVLNATLQNEDNQSFTLHLNSFKNGTWHAQAFPLTHRPLYYYMHHGDSDYFPFLDNGLTFPVNKFRLNYRYTGQTTFHQSTANIISFFGGVLYIPNGPKNLTSLFPMINFNDIAEYFIEGIGGAGAGGTIMTTTLNQLSRRCDESIRVHFVNYLGTIDAINFTEQIREHETKSTSFERSTTYPLDKTVHGVNRFNVKSNTIYKVVSTDYNEAQMSWIEELFDSGKAWMEWTGTQGQTDSYIPILITDQNFTPRKVEDRFIYELTLEFKLSHDKILIRN